MQGSDKGTLFENHRKSLINIASEASYVYTVLPDRTISIGQILAKMPNAKIEK